MAGAHKRDASCGSFNNSHGWPDEEGLLSDARVKIHNITSAQRAELHNLYLWACFNSNGTTGLNPSNVKAPSYNLRTLVLSNNFLILHILCFLKYLQRAPLHMKNQKK